MSFHVLYIEDDPVYQNKIKEAIIELNNENSEKEPILIDTIDNPKCLYDTLNPIYDLIIADYMFEYPGDGRIVKAEGLTEIIETVKEWTLRNKLGRSIPIIAYTGYSRAAIKECLKRRKDLYDIWDKSSAHPNYAAWRISVIALELSRIRPDALLQRLIHKMEDGSTWHKFVIDMIVRYDNARSEADQIIGTSQGIANIMHELKVYDACDMLWESVKDWEPLGRAVSSKTRGHARHVINVFWLGYYLIYHPLLKDFFINSWEGILLRYKQPIKPDKSEYLNDISNCWFFASLFHDMANCLEKYKHVINYTKEILSRFKYLVNLENIKTKSIVSSEVSILAQTIWNSLGEASSIFQPQWEKGLSKGIPDHGVLAGIELFSILKESPLEFIAEQASCAMATHNLINELEYNNQPVLSWKKNPICCLLILCDQIQTWDRERGDTNLKVQEPERAELTRLDIQSDNEETCIKISINYLGPRYLDNSPIEIYNKIKDELEIVLKKKPNFALNKINKQWPFHLELKCYLNNSKLSTEMKF